MTIQVTYDTKCNGYACESPGATDITDTSAVFSNYGSCVDIYAPGVNVLATYLDGGELVTSGTSIACPQVTGAIARYMSSLDAAPTVEEVSGKV